MEPSWMVKIYEESISNWVDDSPLTYPQEMMLMHGGETLEEILRAELERLHYWRLQEGSLIGT